MSFFPYDPKMIGPFNKASINSLKSNKESELIIFFLDHGSKESFSYIPYYHLIERINEIEFHHATIFNETCNSGHL